MKKIKSLLTPIINRIKNRNQNYLTIIVNTRENIKLNIIRLKDLPGVKTIETSIENLITYAEPFLSHKEHEALKKELNKLLSDKEQFLLKKEKLYANFRRSDYRNS